MTEKQNYDDRTILELQRIRRANNGILGCVRILNEHHSNGGSIPGSKGVFIRLDAQQESGLAFAIEACADMIDGLFEEYFEDRGVWWNEEHLPKIREQSESMDSYLNGETSFEQFKEENGMDPSIQ